MTTIHLHEAQPDHADHILAVLVAAFEQYRDQLDPPSGVFRETAADIRQKLARGGGFVACDEQRIIGAVLYQAHPDYMYLGRLAVLPDYRGQHIATRLITQVEQQALVRQLATVRLNVRLSLTGNQRFFHSVGYTITDYCCHENYTEFTYVTMEKKLTLA
ncbi:MAG: GNAT family N-acetyltransferase [Anaerolineae bacterium]|nr:GNAT family N-acetyltransferase [Anaerolineae bacterium]